MLRRACTYDLDTAVFREDIERLMVLGSAGRDVAEFLHKNYPDEAVDILTYKADGGLTSLRANPLKTDAAALCEKLTALGVREVRQGVVPGSVLARFEGSPADQELFRQGYYHVEGQASQLAALCVEAKPGETVLDLCAAPAARPCCWPRKCRIPVRCTAATRRRTAYSSSAPPRNGWALPT